MTTHSRCARRAGLALILACAALGCTERAHADDFIVYSPHVIATQTEVELRGYDVSDGRDDYNGDRAAELSVAHAFTSWWKPELYLAEYAREPGEGGKLVGYEFENTFQLTEPGRYWADFGLLASYEHPKGGGPGGFSAALLPLLAVAPGAGEGLQAQRQRLQEHPIEPRAYYSQVLALFGQGWDESRYRFDEQGRLLPAWSVSCTE